MAAILKMLGDSDNIESVEVCLTNTESGSYITI
ncbi:MAG: PTS transporter subunit EIIB [Alistipes sp.]|nr:PTS transporter subunit EIIB [Alistipes sp.]